MQCEFLIDGMDLNISLYTPGKNNALPLARFLELNETLQRGFFPEQTGVKVDMQLSHGQTSLLIPYEAVHKLFGLFFRGVEAVWTGGYHYEWSEQHTAYEVLIQHLDKDQLIVYLADRENDPERKFYFNDQFQIKMRPMYVDEDDSSPPDYLIAPKVQFYQAVWANFQELKAAFNSLGKEQYLYIPNEIWEEAVPLLTQKGIIV